MAASGATEPVEDRVPPPSLREATAASGWRRDKDIDRFGRWAGAFDESRLQPIIFGPLQDFTLDQATLECARPRAILDIGCGTGQLLRRAALRFPEARLTGIDAAAGMIEVARASVPAGSRFEFVEAFAEDLPFANASFDMVVTTMSFHHWADQPAALREVRRVLAPDGVFAATDAVPGSSGAVRWFFKLQRHGRFPEVDELARMVCAAGMQPRRLVPARGFPTVRAAIARPRSGPAIA